MLFVLFIVHVYLRNMKISFQTYHGNLWFFLVSVITHLCRTIHLLFFQTFCMFERQQLSATSVYYAVLYFFTSLNTLNTSCFANMIFKIFMSVKVHFLLVDKKCTWTRFLFTTRFISSNITLLYLMPYHYHAPNLVCSLLDHPRAWQNYSQSEFFGLVFHLKNRTLLHCVFA